MKILMKELEYLKTKWKHYLNSKDGSYSPEQDKITQSLLLSEFHNSENFMQGLIGESTIVENPFTNP